MDTAGAINYLTSVKAPAPELMVWVVLVVELVVGIYAHSRSGNSIRGAARLHLRGNRDRARPRYWEYPAAAQAAQYINFTKNIAILGGLLATWPLTLIVARHRTPLQMASGSFLGSRRPRMAGLALGTISPVRLLAAIRDRDNCIGILVETDLQHGRSIGCACAPKASAASATARRSEGRSSTAATLAP